MSISISVQKKMLNVIEQLNGVQQTGYNSYQKYNYIKQEDIINVIKPLLVQQRLLITSGVIDEESIIIEGKGILCKVTIEFVITDLDTGEQLIKTYKGHGIDPGDKAIYKAMTGAEKYFYMKNFLIGAVNDDPEYNGAHDVIITNNSPRKENDRNRNNNQNSNRSVNSKPNNNGATRNSINSSNNMQYNMQHNNQSSVSKPIITEHEEMNNNLNSNINNDIKNKPINNNVEENPSEKTIDVRLQKLLFTAANNEQVIVLNAIRKLGYKAPNEVKIVDYKKVLSLIKAQLKLVEFD